jgi:glycosyltransferase involved in cell wall biosynthesis
MTRLHQHPGHWRHSRLLDLMAGQAARRAHRAAPERDELDPPQTKTGLAHYLRSERNNWILRYIRKNLADTIIYQSDFARTWWQTAAGQVQARGRVVYNGVDLHAFHPDGMHDRPKGHQRLLLVEGHLGGGNEQGLDNAVRLGQALNQQGRRVELMVVGDVPPSIARPL